MGRVNWQQADLRVMGQVSCAFGSEPSAGCYLGWLSLSGNALSSCWRLSASRSEPFGRSALDRNQVTCGGVVGCVRARAERWVAAVIGVLTGCVAAAGCAAGPGTVKPHPASPSRAAGSGGRSPAAAARCGGPVRVGRGVTAPPWRLGAVGFL